MTELNSQLLDLKLTYILPFTGVPTISYCIIHNLCLVVKWLCDLKNGLVTQLLGDLDTLVF